jgi:hypothetical protein
MGMILTGAIWALLAHNLFTTLYLGYLKFAAGFVGALVCRSSFYTLIALLLVGPGYERVSAANIGRVNQH